MLSFTILGIYRRVTIQPKNYPDHRIGAYSNMLYVTKDYIVSFLEVKPGLSGDKETVSFRSIKDGRYMAIDSIAAIDYRDLGLKQLEYDPNFAITATFKVHSDKFFKVRKGL